jgi:hypothetical protein
LIDLLFFSMISSQTRAERYKRYAEAVLSISLARTVPASIDVPARRPCIAPRPHATAPTVVARPILSVANRFLTMDPHGLVSISRQFSRQHISRQRDERNYVEAHCPSLVASVLSLVIIC